MIILYIIIIVTKILLLVTNTNILLYSGENRKCEKMYQNH